MRIRSLATKLMWPMVLFLPVWITIGRAVLGSAGWLLFIYIFTIGPVLLIGLLAVTILLRTSQQFKTERLVSKPQAIILLALYGSILLHGLFVIDGADTEESVQSVMTHLLGRWMELPSMIIGYGTFMIGCVLLTVALIMSLRARFKALRSRRALIIAATAVILIALSTMVTGAIHRNSPQAKDEQTSYDFQLLHQDIERPALDSGQLPAGTALQQAQVGEYSKQFGVVKRAGAYDYRRDSSKNYRLCAMFLTDTMNGYVSEGKDSDNEYYHHAGYQCIRYSI